MYTELILGCGLKEDTPIEVLLTLADMIGNDNLVCALLDLLPPNYVFEPVFKTSSGRNVLIGSSYSFLPMTVNRMWFDENWNTYYISTRSNIKNYEGEIEQFLTWLKPYISTGSCTYKGDFYAITTYEEGEPKIYYLN